MNYIATLISTNLFFLLAINPGVVKQKNMVSLHPTIAPISRISYNATGGRGGNTVSLEITAKTITYVKGHAGTEKTITEKTSVVLWRNLTRSLNLKDFDRIKSNPGHEMYDGIDVTITVQQGRQTHSIVNGSEDEVHYNKIGTFVRILVSQLDRLDKKINW